jgi:hypothetical protein
LNIIESSEINSPIWSWIIFNKGAKATKWTEWSLPQIILRNWICTCNRMNWTPYLTLYIKSHWKYIKDPNLRYNTIKILKENTLRKPHDNWVGNDFLNIMWKLQATKAKIDKQNYKKLSNFCISNDTIRRTFLKNLRNVRKC